MTYKKEYIERVTQYLEKNLPNDVTSLNLSVKLTNLGISSWDWVALTADGRKVAGHQQIKELD